MTKHNPKTIKEQKDLIVQALIGKELRQKSLNGEIIQTYDAKGNLDAIPRYFAKLDAPCDTTAKQIDNPKRKTDVKG